MVSECSRPSGRNELAHELQKYIDIDIYGSCGNLTCPPFPQVCLNVTDTYKFYLAFENSLCKDYITEKTYKIMEYELAIPVIYSGANVSHFLPPRSYIDANAFDTVEDLGKYLKFLSENPKEYVKYFWYKKHYKIVHAWIDMCEICDKLNDPNFHAMKHVYKSADEESFIKNSCTKPKIKF